RLAAFRRLANREQALARSDQVDFLVVDAILGRYEHGDEKHAEDVATVTFELRPRLVVVLRVCQQLLERAGVDVLRQVLSQLLGRGVEQVDPLRHAQLRGAASAAIRWPSSAAR